MPQSRCVDLILNALRFHRQITPPLVADVADERMTAQPSGIVNHAAWQLGHITVTLHQGGRLLGSRFELPEGWEPKFAMGSQVVAGRDANPSKADLLMALEGVADGFEQALSSASDDQIAQPTPDTKFRMLMPTVADVAAFVAGTHYAYHLGQLSAWRRAQGLPSALGV